MAGDNRRSGLYALSHTILAFLTPSCFLGASPDVGGDKDSWVVGLKGLIVVGVYAAHTTPSLLVEEPLGQLSSLPLASTAGTTCVSVFLLLSGYALSWHPQQRAQADGIEPAVKAMSSSLLRRPLRLCLPPIASTFVVMLLTRMGIFEWAATPSMAAMYPARQKNVWYQLLDWMRFVGTQLLWRSSGSRDVQLSSYGRHLGLLQLIMKGSILIYLLCLVAINMNRGTRRLALVAFISACLARAEHTAALFATGLLLVDFKRHHDASLCTPLIGWRKPPQFFIALFWSFLLIGGLYVGSIAGKGTTTAHSTVDSLVHGLALRPVISAIVTTWSIAHLAPIQNVLNSKVLLYLGKISFSQYIISEPFFLMLARRVMKSTQEATVHQSRPVVALSLLLGWAAITLTFLFCADLFWQHVEVPSVGLARQTESYLADRDEEYIYKIYPDVPIDIPTNTSALKDSELEDESHWKLEWPKLAMARLSFSTATWLPLMVLALAFAMFCFGPLLPSATISAVSSAPSPQALLPPAAPRNGISLGFQDYLAHNEGPRSQAFVAAHNMTSWLPPSRNLDDYISRLDDQTLIPKERFDSYEQKIRAYFARKYPQLEAVVREGLNTNASYIGGSEVTRQFEIGYRFHITHCVVAMRRFWRALDLDWHVAPRDLSLSHINHCLMTLEEVTLDDRFWSHDPWWGLRWETMVVW